MNSKFVCNGVLIPYIGNIPAKGQTLCSMDNNCGISCLWCSHCVKLTCKGTTRLTILSTNLIEWDTESILISKLDMDIPESRYQKYRVLWGMPILSVSFAYFAFHLTGNTSESPPNYILHNSKVNEGNSIYWYIAYLGGLCDLRGHLACTQQVTGYVKDAVYAQMC